ncbi:MAG: hypothetical protein JWM87_4540 [Candidatus Eremiobacteraeota bacterium]|nr:hypothetical protein [Candidatus Eremiobacteraeota bacterium]
MITRLARIAACAIAAAVALAGQAGAQTASPSPTPVSAPTAAPAPAGFSAHAHANVTVVTPSGTYGGTAQLGMAQRASRTRIDVLSLKSESVPIPPIAATVVINRQANTLTVWSNTTKLYRVQPFLPRAAPSTSPRASATPRPRATMQPSPSPGPVSRGTSPFAKLDVLSVTLKLTGHTTTAGLPTTGLSFDLQVKNKGDAGPTHVTATTQLADEYAVFPMTIDISVEPGTAPFSAKLGYAVDDLTPGMPPTASFTIPAGYREAPSLFGVIFPGRSPRMPSRAPSPSPSPLR